MTNESPQPIFDNYEVCTTTGRLARLCWCCEGDAEREAAFDTLPEGTGAAIPKGWEDAPISALAAWAVAGDDADLFDQVKANLKGEGHNY